MGKSQTYGKNAKSGPAIVVSSAWVKPWRTSYKPFSQKAAAELLDIDLATYRHWDRNKGGIGKDNRETILSTEPDKDPRLRTPQERQRFKDFQERLTAEIKKASADTPGPQGTAEAVASELSSPQPSAPPPEANDSQRVRSLRIHIAEAAGQIQRAKLHQQLKPKNRDEAKELWTEAYNRLADAHNDLLGAHDRLARDLQEQQTATDSLELAKWEEKAQGDGLDSSIARWHLDAVRAQRLEQARELGLLQEWIRTLEASHEEWGAAEARMGRFWKNLSAELPKLEVKWSFNPADSSQRGSELTAAAVAANGHLRAAVLSGGDPAEVCVSYLGQMTQCIESIRGLSVGFSPADCAVFCETVHSWKHLIPGASMQVFRDALTNLVKPLDLAAGLPVWDAHILDLQNSLKTRRGLEAQYSLFPPSENSKTAALLSKETEELLAMATRAARALGELVSETMPPAEVGS